MLGRESFLEKKVRRRRNGQAMAPEKGEGGSLQTALILLLLVFMVYSLIHFIGETTTRKRLEFEVLGW